MACPRALAAPSVDAVTRDAPVAVNTTASTSANIKFANLNFNFIL